MLIGFSLLSSDELTITEIMVLFKIGNAELYLITLKHTLTCLLIIRCCMIYDELSLELLLLCLFRKWSSIGPTTN